MDQELATEATAELEHKPVTPLPALEVWAANERMRHIPSIDTMIQKLEGDLWGRLNALAEPFYSLPSADPRHATIDAALRAACQSIDRLGDLARHNRGASHPPAELPNRIAWSVNNAIAALRSIDATVFGRRFPYHTSDRSKAECVYAGYLSVIQKIGEVLPLIRAIDPTLDERLLQGLVNLQEPMRPEPMA